MDVFSQLAPCHFAVPPPPEGQSIDAASINLFLWPSGGEPFELLRSLDPDCTDGWYLGETELALTICSYSCALVCSDPELALELMFGCASDFVATE
jgi:hypothetical protein